MRSRGSSGLVDETHTNGLGSELPTLIASTTRIKSKGTAEGLPIEIEPISSGLFYLNSVMY
jgi:hypothetical protein